MNSKSSYIKVLKKLQEFKDNMHKKTYLREVCGSDNIIPLMDYILGIVDQKTYEGSDPHIIKDLHDILFRISSRFLNRWIGRAPLRSPKEEKAINSKFGKICSIKGSYWKRYLN